MKSVHTHERLTHEYFWGVHENFQIYGNAINDIINHGGLEKMGKGGAKQWAYKLLS